MLTEGFLATSPDSADVRSRLIKKGIPPTAAREVVWAFYPNSAMEQLPLRPVTGDPIAAERLVRGFGFGPKKAEELWRLLWNSSTEQYFEPAEPSPKLGDDEPYWPDESGATYFGYPEVCFLRWQGAPCYGNGQPPFWPRAWRRPSTDDWYGVWLCRGCLDEVVGRNPSDSEALKTYERGVADILVPLRQPFAWTRLSQLQRRDDRGE